MKWKTGSKIVFTGGPCAGKTTLVQLVERAFPASVVSVPEAASLLFSGGFPRFDPIAAKRAAQRAIYLVQRELEVAYVATFPDRMLVLDRGTVDGAAYWPEGATDFFLQQGTTLDAELKRYDQVIYLSSAAEADYLLHKERNPNRKEDWEEAHRLDIETMRLWRQHPNFTLIPNNRSFQRKVLEVLAVLAESFSFGKLDENK